MADATLNILVIAVGGNVSQGILKCLARSSLSCRVVGADISAAQAGLFTVDQSYVAPWAKAAEFVDWLLQVCKDERIDAILSGAEAVLHVLATHRELIEKQTGAVCLVSDESVMRIGGDKLLTCQWLEQEGFNCPRYAAAQDNAAVARLLAECGYPLIAKPRRGGGSYGLLEVRDEADLAYVARRTDYILQEWLGTVTDEYTAACFCDAQGAVCGSIVMKRELLCGTTYRAFLGEYPEVRTEAERITRALKTLGPCNIQLRMTTRGPVCFEINPRFSGTGPLRAFYGYNEVEAALRHFVLGEAPAPLPLVTAGIALRYWNEMYVDPAAHRQLQETQCLEHPHEFPLTIEQYGMRQ